MGTRDPGKNRVKARQMRGLSESSSESSSHGSKSMSRSVRGWIASSDSGTSASAFAAMAESARGGIPGAQHDQSCESPRKCAVLSELLPRDQIPINCTTANVKDRAPSRRLLSNLRWDKCRKLN